MALISTLLGAVRLVLYRAGTGQVMALRAATAAASAMSAIGKQFSNQRSRAFSRPQTEPPVAAIEVEIFLTSWRGRHPSAEAQR
jgi:hypothetical protein